MSFIDIIKFFENNEKYIFEVIKLEHNDIIEYLEFNYDDQIMKPVITLDKSGMYEDIEFVIINYDLYLTNVGIYQTQITEIYELYKKLFND